MLLIDGVKYQEWTPTNEEELENMVKEHAQEIFGENSIYLDIKHKIKSKSGVGSIPDGYVIILGDSPQWHIIEVELSSHPLHEHIVSQIGKFISGIRNPATQSDIVNAIYDEIKTDDLLCYKMRKAIISDEIHKYLSDCISKSPIVTIIIESKTPELDEALNAINHPQKKVVQFQTFKREAAETVHAHQFEPLPSTPPPPPDPPKGPLIDLRIGSSYNGLILVDKKDDRQLWRSPKGNFTVTKVKDNKLATILYAQPNNEEKARKVLETGIT